jgi:hypothetical protein
MSGPTTADTFLGIPPANSHLSAHAQEAVFFRGDLGSRAACCSMPAFREGRSALPAVSLAPVLEEGLDRPSHRSLTRQGLVTTPLVTLTLPAAAGGLSELSALRLSPLGRPSGGPVGRPSRSSEQVLRSARRFDCRQGL